MFLYDFMCLVVMGLVREIIVRIYIVFWFLMYNVFCIRDIIYIWVIVILDLLSNIELIVKKKKLCILYCSFLLVEFKNEVFYVNLMFWDKFGEKYEYVLILYSIICCFLL